MINQETLQGNWNQLAGKLRSKWGQLTEDELERAHGDVDQLVGLIQRKTGEARQNIEHFLDDATAAGASAFSQAAETARKMSHDAGDALHETSRRAADAVREGYEQAESMVKNRPVESLAVCFGAGVLLGVVVGITLRSR